MVVGFNEIVSTSNDVYLALERMILASGVDCSCGTSTAGITLADLQIPSDTDPNERENFLKIKAVLSELAGALSGATFTDGTSAITSNDFTRGLPNNPAIRYFIVRHLFQSMYNGNIADAHNFEIVLPLMASLPMRALLSGKELCMVDAEGDETVITPGTIRLVSEWLCSESVDYFFQELSQKLFAEINDEPSFKESGITADFVANTLASIRSSIVSAAEMM